MNFLIVNLKLFFVNVTKFRRKEIVGRCLLSWRLFCRQPAPSPIRFRRESGLALVGSRRERWTLRAIIQSSASESFAILT